MDTPLTVAERQVKMRLDIEADDIGYCLVPKDMYIAELKMAILPKLIARNMSNLSQSTTVTFQCFPWKVVWEIFPASLRVPEEDTYPAHTAIFKATTMDECQLVMGDLMETATSSGLTRSLKTISEKYCRRVAIVVPSTKWTYSRSEAGTTTLHGNLMYALMTDSGDICWPKDSSNSEIYFTAEEENSIRSKVRGDVKRIIEKGVQPMSDDFYLMCGLSPPERGRKKKVSNSTRTTQSPAKSPKAKVQKFDVDAILEERPSNGKAVKWYRVRWAGYSPSWETWRRWGTPGSPLETWEPLCHVKGTEALAAWELAASNSILGPASTSAGPYAELELAMAEADNSA